MRARRKRELERKTALVNKVHRAERTGQLALERDEVTQVLDLACERVRATTADTSAAIERTIRSTLPPPPNKEQHP